MKLVTKGIWRSGRPTHSDLIVGKYKSVLNLENDPEAVVKEELWCKELGINFYNVPMSEIWHPSKERLMLVCLDILIIRRPILVHCKHGHERTGIVIAEYRIRSGWSKWEAIKEALREGFSPFFLWWFL